MVTILRSLGSGYCSLVWHDLISGKPCRLEDNRKARAASMLEMVPIESVTGEISAVWNTDGDCGTAGLDAPWQCNNNKARHYHLRIKQNVEPNYMPPHLSDA